MTGRRVTLQDVLDALSRAGVRMRRSGGEWHGACPSCGGSKRFWVREGASQSVIARCRECNLGADWRGFLSVLGLAPADDRLFPRSGPAAARMLGGFRPVEAAGGGGTNAGGVGAMAPAPPATRTGGAAGRGSDSPPIGGAAPARSPLPGSAWSAGRDANGTLGAAYLRRRRVLFSGEVLPAACVRWIDAAAWDARLIPRLPADAAGALIYLFAGTGDDGEVHAVQVEAVDGLGCRVAFVRHSGELVNRASVSGSDFGRGRRVFAPPPSADRLEGAWIVEGPIDALALARSRLPGPACVLGVAGVAGFQWRAVEGVEGEIVIAPDGDTAGCSAAVKLAAALERSGRRWRIHRPGPGVDWCDALADEETEREAIRDE